VGPRQGFARRTAGTRQTPRPTHGRVVRALDSRKDSRTPNHALRAASDPRAARQPTRCGRERDGDAVSEWMDPPCRPDEHGHRALRPPSRERTPPRTTGSAQADPDDDPEGRPDAQRLAPSRPLQTTGGSSGRRRSSAPRRGRPPPRRGDAFSARLHFPPP
jgi:hypothetical protein